MYEDIYRFHAVSKTASTLNSFNAYESNQLHMLLLTSVLTFSSLQVFYCLELRVVSLLQRDRNSLPSATALHTNHHLHGTRRAPDDGGG